ncbi:N-acetyltransferase family protein [Geoglobus ahangari]
MKEVEIREASPEDYEGEKYEFVYRWLSDVSEFLYFAPSEDRMDEDRARFLELLRSGRVIVAVAGDGRVVGQCSLIRLNSPKLSHVANVGIAVAREYQRMGIGRALLEKAEEVARSEGIKKIEVEVVEENIPSLSLFRKMGYHEEGVRKKKFNHRGKLINVVLLGKFL